MRQLLTIFDIIDKNEIGWLQLQGYHIQDLDGVTSAVSHARMNVLVAKELVTIRVMIGSDIRRLSFKILADTLSVPGALLDGNLLITFSTCLSVT